MSSRPTTPAPPARRPRLFGTDGIRGAFGRHPLDEATVRGLAAALAEELREDLSRARPSGATRPRIVLGGDTRDSTPVLCRWLTEELIGRGVEPTYLGIVPTPCVAFAARAVKAACGIVVSASHNPHPDNGIKLVDSEGFKWSTAAELRLEQRLQAGRPPGGKTGPTPGGGAAVELVPDRKLVEGYRQGLLASLDGPRPLDGLAVALDAGNGAASAFARQLFEQLGARVSIVHDAPDGSNINHGCGSTYPQVVAERVRSTGADLGFSFDGDADRVVVADESGDVRDGDAVLYLWGRDLARRGRLPGRRLVATSMSNLGLEVALHRDGISIKRCDVGDREVVEAMRRDGIELGGEQSGHIVSLSLSTTGDGLLTALQVAGLKQRDGRPLSAMLEGFERFPQLLKNLPVRHKPDLGSLPRVVAASREVERKLGSAGRLVLRYSGTEALVRIMIEGPTREGIEALADELAAVLEEELS